MSYGNSILNFWDTSILFSIVAVPLYILNSNPQGFPVSMFITYLFDSLMDLGWNFILDLDFISLIISEVERLFMYVHHVYEIFWNKCQSRSSAHLKTEFFFLLYCMSSLYILDTNPLSLLRICNIFSHWEDCLFISYFLYWAETF